MTMTGFTLDDLGRSLPWRALLAFVRNLPPASATCRARSEECMEAGLWCDPAMMPQLMAAMIDELRAFEWMFARAHGDKRSRRPERIERPGVKPRKVRYGRDAVPVRDFARWWNGG